MKPETINDFEWDEDNERSATSHGYTVDQIEGAFTPRMWPKRSRNGTYLGLVHLEDGFYVEIAFEYLGRGKVRVFHCDTMKKWQKRQYEERF